MLEGAASSPGEAKPFPVSMDDDGGSARSFNGVQAGIVDSLANMVAGKPVSEAEPRVESGIEMLTNLVLLLPASSAKRG